jgi:hypothetical protein
MLRLHNPVFTNLNQKQPGLPPGCFFIPCAETLLFHRLKKFDRGFGMISRAIAPSTRRAEKDM